MTPECVYYEDPYSNIHYGPPDKVLPTPEAGINYVNAEVKFTRGDELAMGQVIKRARDLDGNPLVTSNYNPILNTRQFIVEFSDGDQAELAANVIASNIYAQCDPDGNQHVLLYSVINFLCSTTAICHADQKMI